MSRATFQPKTRQENEREITRIQEDFSAGMIRDTTVIPENGVADLVDIVSKGGYLETRTGSREWGDWANLTVKSNPAWVYSKTYGLYFHKNSKKVYAQIDDTLYVASDIYLSSWTACQHVSVQGLHATFSTFDEYENYLYIFNSGGIFKLNTLDTNNFYYKINTEIPTVKITNTNADSVNPEKPSSSTYKYGRKYVYSMSRLTGVGNRNRQTPGTVIELESGTNKFDSNYIDYGVTWKATEFDGLTQSAVGTLTAPLQYYDPSSVNQHWTHYSLYATKDIGENGTDPVIGEGNNKELFIWVDDIPIIKTFMAASVVDAADLGYLVTLASGEFHKTDVGSELYFNDETHYTITVSNTSNTCLINKTSGIDLINQACCVGSKRTAQISSNLNGNLYVYDTDFFHNYDVGKTVYFSNGTTAFITDYTAGNIITVTPANDTVGLSVSLDPTERNITDYTTDATLESRINYAYTLKQRFWEPLPEANVGIVHQGFMLTAQSDNNAVYYSTLPMSAEYLCGYYYSPFQYMRTQDDIQFISKHLNKCVVWCKNSKYTVPLNTIDTKLVEKIGISYSVLPIISKIQSSIGCSDRFSYCYLPDGESILFISNEPGIRIFDGSTDTDNMATERILNDLKSMKYVYTITYDDVNGVTIWGRT